jgi:hypothetical protein
MLMLLDREIPDISGVRAVLQQRLLLNGRGLKPEPHAHTLTTTTDIPRQLRATNERTDRRKTYVH